MFSVVYNTLILHKVLLNFGEICVTFLSLDLRE